MQLGFKIEAPSPRAVFFGFYWAFVILFGFTIGLGCELISKWFSLFFIPYMCSVLVYFYIDNTLEKEEE